MTLRERERAFKQIMRKGPMLVTRFFSFFHNVFNPSVNVKSHNGVFGNGLKQKMLVTHILSYFNKVFKRLLPLGHQHFLSFLIIFQSCLSQDYTKHWIVTSPKQSLKRHYKCVTLCIHCNNITIYIGYI